MKALDPSDLDGALRALDRDTGEAVGMPRGYYTDPAHFEAEQRTLFTERWCSVGFAHEIPESGDMKPVVFAGHPLFLARGEDGVVRAFHNFCPHRGTQLVSACQNRKMVLCPYHAWSFSLSGELVRAPHHDSCDKAQFGLREARSTTWNDVIFVNLSGDAPPLEEELAPLLERWHGFDFSLMRHGGTMTYEFRSNWKLIVENFLECYHVPSVHPNLAQYSKFSDRYSIMFAEKFFGIGSKVYRPGAVIRELPRWPGIHDRREFEAEYIALCPNTLIGRMPDHVFVWMLEPLSPSETIEHLRFYFIGDDAMGEAYAQERTATLERWKEVNDEDHDIVQRLYSGHESPVFPGARFAPSHEETIHAFHRLTLSALRAPRHTTEQEARQ